MKNPPALSSRSRRRCLAILLALLPVVVASPARAEDDVVVRAMRDELGRSMTQLRLEQLEKPYFMAYTIQEGTTRTVSASLGSLLASSDYRGRFLTVEVRVGDYALDNTNFLSLPFGQSGVVRMFGGTVPLPLEDDYKELRRQIWLATDGAYKQALEDLARKRAALENRTQAEELPDFSRQASVNVTDVRPEARFDAAQGERLVRELSGLFKGFPHVFTSRVQLRVSNVHARYVNSEGTSFVRTSPSVALTVLAATQAPDGMPLEDFATAYGRSIDDLPSQEKLAALLAEVGDRLEKLRNAPLPDRYNGPVLLEGQAAAEVFSQVFVPRLLAARTPIADSPQIGLLLQQMENPFLHKLGGRVLPEFLSVADNAALDNFNGSPLVGGFRIDDEGVPARETALVEKGILKTLLATRNPVAGVPQSTGNRRGGRVLPSNLVVSADNGLSDAELRERFLALVKQRGKEFGIVIRRLGNPALTLSAETMLSRFMSQRREEERVEDPILAYKVFVDGREELIRNVELDDLNTAAFRTVEAASRDRTVYSTPFAVQMLWFSSAMSFFEAAGGEASAPVVSLVVPSLLFEDLTLRKPTGQIPKPPVALPPQFGK